MLKKLLTFFSIIFTVAVQAQTNLVPNPSFEIADTCPTTLDQMSRCQSWSSYGASPDYFNNCSTVTGIAPPYVVTGYQKPLYGNAYAGFATYANAPFSTDYREIIGTQLTSTLSIGIKYYFSFFVSLAGGYGYTLATDKIGLRCSTIPYSETNPLPSNNIANYYCTTIITDTLNWVQLKRFFCS